MIDEFLTRDRDGIVHHFTQDGEEVGGIVYSADTDGIIAFRRKELSEVDLIVETVLYMHEKNLPTNNLQYKKLSTIGGKGRGHEYKIYRFTPATS